MAPGGMSLASTGTASLGGGSPLHVRPDSPTSVGHVKEHADHYSPKGGFSPKGGATAATSKPNGPVPTGGAAEVPAEEEGGLSLLSFTRSIVELQNSVVAWWERREKEERMRFKAAEDAKWKERKATLHRSTHEHELNAKKQKELVGEERLRQHAGWKDEEAERMALIAQRREEWTETAKSSVRYHGKEQDARIKAERNESTEGKQEFARAGKLESQVHKQRISTERERKAEEHRQKVSELTQSRKGKAEESCLYAYSGRVGTAKEVQQREAEWKQLSQQQRDAFMARAHENRADANQTTAQMRANQKDLIAQRNGAVHSERRTKEEHSAALHESQEKVYSAKKIVRDAVYLARQISPDKAKVLSDFKRKVARSPNKSPELAAELGLIESSGRPKSRETSPYRLSPRSPAEIAEAKARSIESSSMPSHTPSPSKQDQGVLES